MVEPVDACSIIMDEPEMLKKVQECVTDLPLEANAICCRVLIVEETKAW